MRIASSGGQSSAGSAFGAFTLLTGPSGVTSVDVGIAINSSGNLSVATANSSGSASVNSETAPGTWAGWVALSGGSITHISLTRYTDGALAAAVRTTDSYVHTKYQTSPGGTWQSAWSTRGCCITDVAAIVAGSSPGVLAIYGPGGGVAYRMYEMSRGGSWTSWASMGGSGIVNMAVGRLVNGCSVEVGQLSTGNVQTNNESPCGTWSGWINVVRQTPSPDVDVSVVVKPNGEQAIFQVMRDRQIYWRESSTTQGWTALAPLAWTDFARISATSFSDNRLALIGRTIHGQLLVIRQTSPGVWGSWEWIGGYSVDVALSTDNLNKLAFVTVNTDGSASYVRENSPGSWVWTSLAGGAITRVSLARYTDGSLAAAVVTGSNGYSYTKKQTTPGGTWESAWTQRGSSPISDVAAMVSGSSPGVLVLYGVTSTNSIQRKWETSYGGSWTGWQNMGGTGYYSIGAATLPNGCAIQVGQRSNGTVDTNIENPCGTWTSWIAPATVAATRYTYNTTGAVVTVTDPIGNVTTNSYDLLGRVTSVNDPNRGVSLMTYDANSNLLATTDARGITLTTTYDALNRPTALSNGATVLTQAVYDATGEKGLLDWSASYDAGEQYKTDITGYNDAYQPTQMVITVPSNSHTSGLAGSYTYTTSYRVDGSPVSETYPAVGGLPAERITYGNAVTGEALWTSGQDLDGTGAPTGSPHTYVSSTSYDAFGRLTTRQLGDTSGVSPNVTRGYSYDSLGRLSALTANFQFGTGTSTVLQSTAYTFDANNNVASRQDAISGQIECFGYDARNRLTRAYTAASCGGSLQDTPGPNPYERTYTFDAASRMTSVASRTAVAQSFTTRTYSYATTSPGSGCTAGTASSKPHAPSGVTGYSFSYDCAGNSTSRTTPTASFTQAWDPQGRLNQVVRTAGTTGNYIYGPDNQRLIQEDGTTRTLYVPRQEVVSVDGASATAARYYSVGGATVAARRTGTNAGNYFLGGDGQGSVSWMVNTATGAATSSSYYPYGEVRGASNQMPTDRGFVGQIEDDTTGLDYFNHRYYDAWTGVFMSVDPLVGRTGTPYLYANGNPTTLADPSGLCAGVEGTLKSCGIDRDGKGLRRGQIHHVRSEIKGTNEVGAEQYTLAFVRDMQPELGDVATQVRVKTPLGLRILDFAFAIRGSSAIAVESKAGGTKKGGRSGAAFQAEKDAYLLRNGMVLDAFDGRRVIGVQWHFWPGLNGRMPGNGPVLAASLSGGDVWVHDPRLPTESERNRKSEVLAGADPMFVVDVSTGGLGPQRMSDAIQWNSSGAGLTAENYVGLSTRGEGMGGMVIPVNFGGSIGSEGAQPTRAA